MQTILTKTKTRPFRAGLASSNLLRSIALPLLRRLDQPVTIKNPFSGLPFHLLSYTHKGYWFYGKHRERATMQRLAQVIRKGDIICEVGGHIGYLTQFFTRQVGHTGQVHVFEPGEENQRFLRKNIARCLQCVHINAAVSDQTGKVAFYEENMGGFMNSLDADFAISSNMASKQRKDLKLRARTVNAITLDAYATAHNVWPQVIKIDVEGAELAVLHGAAKVLETARTVMIEVSRHQDEILDILDDHGFVISQPDGTPITAADQMQGNIFALRPGAKGSVRPATDPR